MTKDEITKLIKDKVKEVKEWMLQNTTPKPGSFVNIEHHDGEIKITAINTVGQLSRSVVARHIRIDNRYMGKDIADFIEECEKMQLPFNFGGHCKGYVLY